MDDKRRSPEWILDSPLRDELDKLDGAKSVELWEEAVSYLGQQAAAAEHVNRLAALVLWDAEKRAELALGLAQERNL